MAQNHSLPLLSDDAIARIRHLLLMDDAAFSETFLKSLSPEELAEFKKICPEFPDELLPGKTN